MSTPEAPAVGTPPAPALGFWVAIAAFFLGGMFQQESEFSDGLRISSERWITSARKSGIISNKLYVTCF